MINLDVKWSDVYEIESKSGIPLWTRHWLIPIHCDISLVLTNEMSQ